MAAAESGEQLLISSAHVPTGARISEWLRTSTGLVLVVLAAGPVYATLLAAAAATLQPIALDFGEPMVYGPTQRILDGQPLYQSLAAPPYTVTPYTPLYYYAGAALRVVFGEGFGPGRALSLAAGVVSALLIAFVAARLARATWAGALAAALFLGLAFPGDVPWLGLYRVDMLGLAFSLAAIAGLSYGRGLRSAILSGALAALALLCKETFVAALLAGAVWLWPMRRRLIGFLGAALVVCGMPCFWLQVTTGALLQNVLADVDPLDGSVASALFGQFLRAQWLPLGLLAVCLVLRRPWRRRPERLLLVYLAAASLQLIGLAKVGANHNYWTEFAAVTAMLAALGATGLVRLRAGRLTVAGSLALVAIFAGTSGAGLVKLLAGGLGPMRSEATHVQFDAAMLRSGSTDPDFQALVERVRAEPGLVLADPPDVLVLANRPIYLEPLIFTLLEADGRWRPDGVVRAICTRAVRLVVLSYPLEQDRSEFGHFGPWPTPVLTALRSTMRFVERDAGRDVYVPRPIGSTC